MELRIRPMLRSDLGAVNDISSTAFLEDELFSWMTPGRYKYPLAYREFASYRTAQRMSKSGMWGMVCVDEHDQVVGYAWWKRIVPASRTEAIKTDPWLQNNTSWASWLEVTLVQLQRRYQLFLRLNQAIDHDKAFALDAVDNNDKTLEPLERAAIGWHLSVLAVAPWCQRRGVGSKLIDWGLDLAREETVRTGLSVPVTLTASPVGAKLYPKKGFKIVGWQSNSVSEELQQLGFNPAGGQIFAWDPPRTWIKDLPDDTYGQQGKIVEVTWTEKTLQSSNE